MSVPSIKEDVRNLQEEVDNDSDNLENTVKNFLNKNFDILQYSVTFHSVTIELPQEKIKQPVENGQIPIIKASFMNHEDTISRNTIVTVRGSNLKKKKQVEIRVGDELWTEMKTRWAQKRPRNEELSESLKKYLNIEDD